MPFASVVTLKSAEIWASGGLQQNIQIISIKSGRGRLQEVWTVVFDQK